MSLGTPSHPHCCKNGVEFNVIPYQITGTKGQVFHKTRPLSLAPKAVAVLWTLVRQAG